MAAIGGSGEAGREGGTDSQPSSKARRRGRRCMRGGRTIASLVGTSRPWARLSEAQEDVNMERTCRGNRIGP